MSLGLVSEPMGVNDTDCVILLNFLVVGTLVRVATFNNMPTHKKASGFSFLLHGNRRELGADVPGLNQIVM